MNRMEIQRLPIAQLAPAPYNPRKDLRPGDPSFEKLKRSLSEFGLVEPLIWNRRTGRLVGGHQRLKVLMQLGETEADVSVVDLDEAREKALNVALNNQELQGGWDEQLLADLLQELSEAPIDETLTGFGREQIDELIRQANGSPYDAHPDGPTLAERFVVPPFSILDGRAGYWHERKAWWLEKGIQSELGRDQDMFGYTHLGKGQIGEVSTSVFDPVLCEVAYRWFSQPGGCILDPFAGGSVRGITAGYLGRRYTGIDLRAEQVQANEAQWAHIGPGAPEDAQPPKWITGDSCAMDELVTAEPVFDMLFTCPPYGNLEQYSDNRADLSNMNAAEFAAAYEHIMRLAVQRLKPNRFAVVVVGEYRDKRGNYAGIVPQTIGIMERAGLRLYNEAILVTPVGSMGIRVAKQFTNYRKIGKTHQNVLVFLKGDAKKARAELGDVPELAYAAPDEEAGDDGEGQE